jgi:Ca2+-dependent lipid-binding protein
MLLLTCFAYLISVALCVCCSLVLAAVAPSTYVTVSFKDEVHKTSTVENSASPKWNADFTFKTSNAEPTDLVTFNVFKKETDGGDTSIGVVSILQFY